MTEESKKICRDCVYKDVCRWYPKRPEGFVIRHDKFKSVLQIELEKLFADYCDWYKKKEGET